MIRKSRVLLTMMILAVPMVLGVLPVMSGEANTANMEIVREKLRADKKLFIAQNMGLTESEGKTFWPLYDRYQKDLSKIADRDIQLIKKYAQNFNAMTDGVARELMDDWMGIERDQAKLRQAYLPQFRRILDEIKVARYYQLENKIQAVVDYEIAAQIPLVQ